MIRFIGLMVVIIDFVDNTKVDRLNWQGVT